MKFSSSTLFLIAIPFLASASPVHDRVQGIVRMVFDIGGSREVLQIKAGHDSECISIASGGILTNIKTPSNVVCYLRANGCGGDSPVSPPMSGHVNLNGSGQLAEMAKIARSIECGPRQKTQGLHTVNMEIKLDGVADNVEMEVSKKGCISLPGDLTIESMNIGSAVTCYLATDCQTKRSVGGTLSGDVNVRSIQRSVGRAGGLACTPVA